MSYIYKVTNRINGKMYIGQHKYDGVGLDPKYFGSGVLLWKAYNKYGIDNFDMELVEECPDEDLNPLEQLYIEHFNTLKPNGYNLTEGGEGVIGYTHSKEVLEKLYKPVSQYDDNGNLVKIYQSIQEAARQLWCNQSAIGQVLNGSCHKAKGFRFRYSNEYGDKIEPYIKSKRYNQRPINQYDDNGDLIKTYQSIAEAAKQLGNAQNNISQVLRGVAKKTYGCRFRYADESGVKIEPYIKPKKYNQKQVDQYSLDNKYIKTWDSMADIERECGYDESAISICCKGKIKQAYGFKWEYKEKAA